MRAVKAFLNLFLIALCAIFIFGAVTDNKNARIMEQAVKGGYEALLAYEGRDNSDTFNTPEDYVAEKSIEYKNKARSLHHRADKALICSAISLLTVIAMNAARLFNKKTE